MEPEVFEFIMLLCFGVSWPISVYKSIKSKSTKGKSWVFSVVIILGYLSGIIGKIVNGKITYVFAFYIINLFFVSLDLCLYFINCKRENKIKNQDE